MWNIWVQTFGDEENLYDMEERCISDWLLISNVTHLLGPKRNPVSASLLAYICRDNSAGTQWSLRQFVLEGEGKRNLWRASV